MPDVLFIRPKETGRLEYKNIKTTEEDMKKMFSISSQNLSGYDLIEQNLDNLIKNNISMSVTSIPLYWLEPNLQIIINDNDFLKQYFEI